MQRTVLQYIVEYVVNCAWQIPLLAAGAWLMVKIVRPGVLAQHWLWLSVMAMAVLLPLRRPDGRDVLRDASQASIAAEEIHPTRPDVFQGAALSQDHSEHPWADDESAPLPFRARSVRLSAAATQWLAGLYALSIAVGAARLGRGWTAARRLVRCSRDAALSRPTRHLLAESCRRLKVRAPLVRASDEADGPVIVGATTPVLLLPERFEEHPEEEIGAVLLHELAHVRRRDYLVNLICQIAALPVIWHPAAHAIQQRIRGTREMACDAIAADEMGSGAEYARCLVSLARGMLRVAETGGRSQVMGLFERNTMEERVMRLTEKRVVLDGRAKAFRVLGGIAAMAAVMGAAMMCHLRPTFAATASVVQNAAVPAPAAPSPPAAQLRPSARVAVPEKTADKTPLAIARGSHANVTVGKGDYVHRWKAADGEPFALVNRDPKEPTPEERRLAEMQLTDSHKEAGEFSKWIGDSNLDWQVQDLQKQLSGIDLKSQLAWANDPATKLRMKELQEQLSTSMPRLKKFDDPEWQKRFADLAKNSQRFDFDFKDWKNQIEIAKAAAIDEARLNEEIAKAMGNNKEQLSRLRQEMESGELKQKLDEATRLLEEVKKQMEAMPTK